MLGSSLIPDTGIYLAIHKTEAIEFSGCYLEHPAIDAFEKEAIRKLGVSMRILAYEIGY